MRTAANYLGKLQGTAIGGVVGSMFGPAGAAVGAAIPSSAGFVLKYLANRMTINQAKQLSEMIRSRAPLASSADKFEEAFAKMAEGKRDPKAIAGVLLAARNLSTNLRSAGLNFSTSDLLKGLQSPSTGNAQEQQQPVPGPVH
jgi:phage-related protein